MADFPVKWFSSDMGGSPAGGKEAGELIELLKACLITGFNITPVVSLTFDSTSELVTAEVGQGHGFLKYQVISITGADQAQFNGDFRVMSATSTAIAFAPSDTPTASTATGSQIEIKAAPVGGWEIVAEDVDRYRAAFRSTSEKGNGLILHVQNDHWETASDDRWDSYLSSFRPQFGAKVKIAYGMESIDTYEALAEARWPIGWDYSEDGREWLLVGDDRLLFYTSRYAKKSQRSTVMYGDFESTVPGDSFNTLIQGIPYSENSEWSKDTGQVYSEFAKYGDFEKSYIARPYNQMPHDEFTRFAKRGLGSASGVMIRYPNPTDFGLYVHSGPTIIEEEIEGNGSAIRGYLPGLVQPLQTATPYHKAILDDLPNLDGVPVIMWLTQYDTSGKSAMVDDGVGMVGWRLDNWRP